MLNKKEKEFIITVSDVTMQLVSYLEIAEAYVEAKYYAPEIVHIGKIISRMKKVLYEQAVLIEPAKFLIKRTQDCSSQIYIENPTNKLI